MQRIAGLRLTTSLPTSPPANFHPARPATSPFAMTPLFKKLQLKDTDRILVLNEPESFAQELSALTGVTILRKSPAKPSLGFAIAFAVTQADLDKFSAKLLQAVEGDALLWLAYPKGTSKRYRCEFNRDSGWTVLGAAGYEPVRQVAIDDDWTALRFRKTEFIKTLHRSSTMAISDEGKRRAKK
jgi:hypothetical protein